MKIGDKVIVSGKSFRNICYLENTAFIKEFVSESEYPISVEFLNGTVDSVNENAVRLWDY